MFLGFINWQNSVLDPLSNALFLQFEILSFPFRKFSALCCEEQINTFKYIGYEDSAVRKQTCQKTIIINWFESLGAKYLESEIGCVYSDN